MIFVPPSPPEGYELGKTRQQELEAQGDQERRATAGRAESGTGRRGLLGWLRGRLGRKA